MEVRIILSLLLFLGLVTQSKADESKAQFYFNHLNNNDGLSSSRVNCIYEDSDGFIWFGTEDGLNLFDGISIKVFKNDIADTTSLCNNAVYSMVCDSLSGNLWIGTRKGICCFDKFTNRFKQMFQHSEEYADINDHIIYDLKFDKEGRLWMATSYGLYSYNVKTELLSRYTYQGNDENSIISNNINHVFIDDNHRILISTRGGVDLYNEATNKFEHLFGADSLRNVMQISKDSYGEYWICTDDMGVFVASYDGNYQLVKFKSGQHLDLHSARIHSIIEDDAKNLFILARDKGLYYFDRQADKIFFYEPDIFDSQSLSSKALISSYKSSSGILWLGTFNRGVNYIDINRKPFEHYRINYKESGLFNNNVRSFFQDSEGAVWIGTKEGGGLSRFYPESGTFDNYRYAPNIPNSFSHDYVLTINELNKDVLMLGTLGEGLDLFNKHTRKVINLKVSSSISDNKIYSIFKDLTNQIWIATLDGLYIFDQRNFNFKQVENVRTVKCFAQNSAEGIWMGTRFEGLIYNQNGIITDFIGNKRLEAIVSNEITALRFANDSILYVGTTNGLIAFNIYSLGLKSWCEADGLPSSRICAIEIDNRNNLWISTSNGLSKYNPQTGTFKNYFVEDGLQGNDFEMYISLKTTEGKLYFGGGNGFNVFDPEKIKNNLRVPLIHFTDFKMANQSVAIGTKSSPLTQHIDRTTNITLKHTQADFTFEFVALNYTSPEKNNYKYQLEGYDTDWVDAGRNRLATYTNIGSGDYVFKVIASNNDNIWNTKGRSIQITILPPPWKSKWAFMGYLVFIGFLVMGFYFVIVNRIEQQSLLRMERHEREKLELVNQLKLRFFTNISHEFRTPLTLISSPLTKLMKDEKLNASEQKYLYATMYKNVKRLLRLMKQLMDFRKLEDQQLLIKVSESNLVEFVRDITKGFQEFAGNKDIDINFESQAIELPTHWFDPNIIDSVIFNLLSNAIKFSPNNTTIKVILAIKGTKASIQVIDHGVGIPADKIDKIFERFYSESNGIDVMAGTGIGLSFTKNLIALHKGEIGVESLPNVETRFTVNFPVNKEAYSSEEWSIAGNNIPEIVHDEKIDNKIQSDVDSSLSASSKRISLLIVEDNMELRKFLKNQLSVYQVYEAADGVEGLNIARKSMPDMIISDVMMPNMDGIQLCAALKSDFITSHIPVILLTAKIANEYKIEGMDSGADAYIEKPFDLGVLEAQIRNLIKQRNRLRKRFSNQFESVAAEATSNIIDQKFFEKAEKIVIENLSNLNFSVEDFGANLGMSRSQLFRKFKAITDSTPSDYIRAEKLKMAKKLLLEGELNVNEISLQTGFSSTSHFIATFKKYTGTTPKEFSQK